MIQLFLSCLLYFIIFFGLAFILNMLLRKTWLMSFFYPIIILLIVGKVNVFRYISNPKESFSLAFENMIKITTIDIIILSSGFIGTIVSGIVIKILRKRGYQMF